MQSANAAGQPVVTIGPLFNLTTTPNAAALPHLNLIQGGKNAVGGRASAASAIVGGSDVQASLGIDWKIVAMVVAVAAALYVARKKKKI